MIFTCSKHNYTGIENPCPDCLFELSSTNYRNKINIMQKQIEARDKYIRHLETVLLLFGASGNIDKRKEIEDADREANL